MTELTVIPKELKDLTEALPKGSESKALALASNYAPILQEVSTQSELLIELKKGSIEDVEKAKRIRLDLGKIRSKAKTQKAKDKESILLEQKFIDSLYNTVDGAISLSQSQASDIEKYFEEQERIRIENLQNERQEEISKMVDVIPENLGSMDLEMWNAYKIGVETSYNQRIEAEAKAEQERLEAQRLDKIEHARKLELAPFAQFIDSSNDLRGMEEDDYRAFFKKLSEAKQEYEEEQERIREENLKLKAEKEKREALQAAKDKKAQAEIEAFKKKEEKEKEALRKKLQAEKEEKERLANIEKERLAEEHKKKAEQEKEEKRKASAPDREKLIALSKEIENIKLPQLKTSQYNQLLEEVQTLLGKVSNHIKTKIES